MTSRVRRAAAAAALTGASLAAVTTTAAPPAGAVSGPLCSGVTGIAPGQTHAFAITANSGAYGFGNNQRGQLAVGGANANRTSPTPSSALSSAKDIAGGSQLTVAAFPDGTVKAVGLNNYGQVGDGTTTSRTELTPVAGLTNVVDVESSGNHVLALRNDGTVWAWGRNLEGQLGDGTTTNRSTPVPVAGLTDVTAIAAGWQHSLALRSDGTVWTWGLNKDGQLGNASRTNATTPVQVVALSGAKAVDGGVNFSVALLDDGTLRGWGSSANGQLGTNGSKTTATRIPGISEVTRVATGSFHVLATTAAGRTYGWGSNTSSQLGLGEPAPGATAPTSVSTPTEIPGAKGATAIAAGATSSYAIRAGGTLWTWGANSQGQLGQGTTTDSKAPAQAGCPSATKLPWGVALVAEPPTATPGTPVRLTAIANQDVADSPYAIQVFDNTTGALLATCATGMTCSGVTTSPSPGTRTYTAYIATPSAMAPPPFVQASAEATVAWGTLGPGPYSGSCGGDVEVFEGHIMGEHGLLHIKRVSSDETWLCFRIKDESRWVGGRLTVIAPAIASPDIRNDDQATRCTATTPNKAPGPHPLVNNTVLVDTYADSGQAWLCLAGPQTSARFMVSANTVPPAVVLNLDTA